MSARKLTDADKQEVLTLYRNSKETTSTLASRYGVSSSTISRLLKNSLAEDEYEALIQQKRLARPQSGGASIHEGFQRDAFTQPVTPASEFESETPTSTPESKRIRRRSSASSTPEETEETFSSSGFSTEFPETDEPEESEDLLDNRPSPGEFSVLQEMFGEDLSDEDDEQDLDDSDEDDDWEEEEEEITSGFPAPRRKRLLGDSNISVEVLPLSQASLPRICYIVVDRASELIARPLKEFSDLGKIPVEEVQQRTLPVFDNHRVAKRFSNRSQRVIKVPDGRMLQKTYTHLEAKGITRLLIDGQIYSLS